MGFIKTIRQRQQYLNHISVGVKFKFLSFLGLTCHDCAKNYEKGFETCLYAPSSNKDILIFHKSRAFKFNTLSGTYALSLILKLAQKVLFFSASGSKPELPVLISYKRYQIFPIS